MPTTTLQPAARPQALALASRPRRMTAALALAAALLGGTSVALAPHADAATAKSTVAAASPAKTGSPVVAVATRYVGAPYRYGGSTPRGFDCSGFTQYVYKKAGVKDLARTTFGQRTAGQRVSRANAKPGDLIWTPGHVGIYVGNGLQIDAPRPGKTIQVRPIWQHRPIFIRVSAKAIGA